MMEVSGQPTVFVVDDERVIAMTTALILSQHGYNALGFQSALEALSKAHEETLDLLIVDIVMPEMSGIRLAMRIAEIRPDVKVLLMSGAAATSDLTEEARRNGHDFPLLMKPVHPMDLMSTIEALLGPSKE